jgi:hypothetical protein
VPAQSHDFRLDRGTAPAGVQWLPCAAAAALALVLVSCQPAMERQPKYLPLSQSSFFADGRSARPLVEGTVAHGSIDRDALDLPPDSNGFPFPLTQAVMERGQQRFNIFCAECHGLTGDGNGIIAQRGLRHPPSYHIDRLRQSPTGHFYDVITHGFGAMQDYSSQIPQRDRWCIVAYIRALQLSQHTEAAKLSADEQQQLDSILNAARGSQ